MRDLIRRPLLPRIGATTGEWLGTDAFAHIPRTGEQRSGGRSDGSRDGRMAPATRRRLRVAAWLERVASLLSARRFVMLLGGALALGGFGTSGYVHAKAEFAQVLLRSAWSRTLSTGTPQRPWPWADTWPVARLRQPRLAIDQIVLAGASGRTLAFGPALSSGAAEPGAAGNAIVSGHRDTHFGFLRDLAIGDRVWLETRTGRHVYAIERFDVADARLARVSTQSDEGRLTLVTCYPFDAITPGGPLRYVATARLVATEAEPVVGDP
jgi:sortase A